MLCAGIMNKCLIKNISRENINEMMSINLFSPILLVQALLKKKKINRYGSIVIMSSISAYYPSISNGLYAASKGALNSFSKSIGIRTITFKGSSKLYSTCFCRNRYVEKIHVARRN